jgi:serine protease AprX
MKRVLRHLPFGLAVLVAGLAVADAPVGAAANLAQQHHVERLDTRLRAVLGDSTPEPQRVIIRVRPGSRPALRASLTAVGDQILGEHESIDALTAIVPGEDLATLADSDEVLSISCDAVVQPHGLLGIVGGLLKVVVNVVGSVVGIILPNGADTSGPVVEPVVLRQTLGVDQTSWTGRGVGVAVIDSGLEMSAEFQNRVTAFYDFTNGGAVAAYPSDAYGHGTHVAGTIGGSGALSQNYSYHGLAPRVTFVILKVLDKNGAGYTSDVIRAIDFAVANRSSLGIDIINLSLGHPIYEPAASDPLVQAVEQASQAGIVVVAAAGNYGKNPTTGTLGYGGITSPGNAPSAITVGSVKTQNTVTRDDDRIADYSSSGPTWYDAYAKPDVVSPGQNIVAVAAKNGTLYQTYPQLKDVNANYMLLSGTSMASAVTTGSVALLLEANRAANYYPAHPSLTPNAVKALLQYTSVGIHDDSGVEYNPLRKGAGSLNPEGAIDLSRRVNTSTASGQWWLTSTPYTWTTIGGETLAWSQDVIWGNEILWGTTVNVNETAWGSEILWGTGTSWSNEILWGTGTDIVWTNPQSWANEILWGTNTIGQSNGTEILWGTCGSTPQTTVWGSLAGTTTATGALKGQ